LAEVDGAAPFVHTLQIKQLLSHLDLSEIIVDFPHLSSLHLTYGARKVAMDFDKSLFGMHLADVKALSSVLQGTSCLHTLVLRENLLNHESVQALMAGLINNSTLTALDLAHNKIGDLGLRRLCAALGNGTVLTRLDLSDNNIHGQGAAALGAALEHARILEHLSIRLNPLGDEGGAQLLQGLQNNSSLRSLHMGACDLGCVHAGRAFVRLVGNNTTLEEVDVSSNSMFSIPDQNVSLDEQLEKAVMSNSSLRVLDLRANPVEARSLTNIKKELSKRTSTLHQANRKLYQGGNWDVAL
jgi:Ran GTPase-activating protein (RanGAP) involved in mRNA processing and transport